MENGIPIQSCRCSWWIREVCLQVVFVLVYWLSVGFGKGVEWSIVVYTWEEGVSEAICVPGFES